MRLFLIFLIQINACLTHFDENYVEKSKPKTPKRIVINTWRMVQANVAAWGVLKDGGSALDAVTTGASVCEAQGSTDRLLLSQGIDISVRCQRSQVKLYNVMDQWDGETSLMKMEKSLLMQ